MKNGNEKCESAADTCDPKPTQLQWELQLNKALVNLSDALIDPSCSIEQMASIVLHYARLLTESRHGFVSSIDPLTGDNVSHTLTEMMETQCKVTGADRKIIFPRGPDGKYPALWGWSLNTRKPFYTNSPQKHPASSGLPEGHVPVANFMSVPAIVEEQVVGQIALANSSTGYNEKLLQATGRIAKIYAAALARKRAENKLAASEKMHRTLLEKMSEGLNLTDPNYVFTYVNDSFCTMLERSRDELIGHHLIDFVDESHKQFMQRQIENRRTGKTKSYELPWKAKSGRIVHTLISPAGLFDKNENFIGSLAVVTDISQRKQTLALKTLVEEILRCLNQNNAVSELIREILTLIKKTTGFAAVGIRLRQGNDFPYFEVDGFADEFVQKENRLCTYEQDGQPVCDEQGKPFLECMCGNVIAGRTDPTLPFFTKAGSFWTNSTTKLIKATPPSQLQTQTRNHCNKAGYESVALIPLRAADRTVGLLQMNDTRPDRFNLEMIKFFEQIGTSIAITLARIWAEQQAESLAKFPSENPNPIIRVAKDGTVLYANNAGNSILSQWNCKLGQLVPTNWLKTITEVFRSGTCINVETEHKSRVFSFVVVPVLKAEYVNLYGRDITHRRKVETDLEKYRRHLEELVHARTAELSQTNIKLMQEIEQRKQLESQLLQISEREQRSIGQELHDSIGQQLTGIAFMVKVLEKRLEKKLPDEAQNAAEIAKLVNQATEQTRGLAKGLHPIDLDAGSLDSALHDLAVTSEHLFSISCRFESKKTVVPADTNTAVNLYRIAQEAVSNAVKHGKAKNITISLTSNQDNSILIIENDGIDFPAKPHKTDGMGLKIMNHRAEIIHASIDIKKREPAGTIVKCIFNTKNTHQNQETQHANPKKSE